MTSSPYTRSCNRWSVLRTGMTAYTNATVHVPYGIYSTTDVGAYASIYTAVCDDTRITDNHARESFRVMKHCSDQVTRSYELGASTKSHVKTMSTIGRMLSQISTRLSFNYDTAWCRHVTKVVQQATNEMNRALNNDAISSMEEWRKVRVCAALFVHCLIADQLRFDCWTSESLSVYRDWIHTLTTYCNTCIEPRHKTDVVLKLLKSCSILDVNIQAASCNAKSRTTGFTEQRCTDCVQTGTGTGAFRMYRRNLVVSCEHTGTGVGWSSPPTGLRPSYPMLNTRGLYASGLNVPPRSFDVHTHRNTIIVLRILRTLCTEKNSTPTMRKCIIRALRASSRVTDKRKQYAITFAYTVELFGMGLATSHQSQYVIVDLLRAMESQLDLYYHEGHTGDNIRAVVWYIATMIIPIITQASMWDQDCKKYYSWCLDKVDSANTRDQQLHTNALSILQNRYDESQTSDDEDDEYQTPYKVECSETVKDMNTSGVWLASDNARKFIHRLMCEPCASCGAQIQDTLYIVVLVHPAVHEDKNGNVRGICSLPCATRYKDTIRCG
jgi:hypothetical protein